MCEHYSRSQPITASFDHKLKPIQLQVFSIFLLLFPMKPTHIYFFPPPFFWSEVGDLQYKRNPAPDLQSLKKHGSLLWSFVSEDLGAAKDTISLLGHLQDSKVLRFTDFVLFCPVECIYEWLLAISRKQKKHFW